MTEREDLMMPKLSGSNNIPSNETETTLHDNVVHSSLVLDDIFPLLLLTDIRSLWIKESSHISSDAQDNANQVCWYCGFVFTTLVSHPDSKFIIIFILKWIGECSITNLNFWAKHKWEKHELNLSCIIFQIDFCWSTFSFF